MQYQDIHIPDRQYWRNWQSRFNSSNTLDNVYLYKAILAQHINAITTALTSLMNEPVDPDFKANVIPTSATLPAQPSSAEGHNVYFQLIFPQSN